MNDKDCDATPSPEEHCHQKQELVRTSKRFKNVFQSQLG